MNKRLLCFMASLLLCGAVSAQTHFEVDTHAQDNNMPVVAQVVLDGQTVTTGGYELGAFVGNAPEARGSAQIQTTLDNTYWIQVYYSTTDEATATVTFKLYDGEDEYTAETTLTIDPEGAGTLSDPVEIVVNRAVTQTTTMTTGWNWWSTPIELGNNGLQLLENALGENGGMINASDGGFVEYIPDWAMWWGSDIQVVNESMYEISITNASSLSLSGARANPTDHPITISQGWNWIGYLAPTNLPVSSALASLTPMENDIIQSRNGFSMYWPGFGFWGDVEEMGPGNGYKYMSNNTTNQTLVYPSNIRSNSDNVFVSVKNNPESYNYRYLMSIVAVIEDEGNELREDSYEIQGISNGKLCGHATLKYFEPLDRYIAMLTIYGDANEQIDFVVNDMQKGGTYTTEEVVSFANEKVVGSIGSPFVLHMNKQKEQASALKDIFPNPVKIGDMVHIAFNNALEDDSIIEVFNGMGERTSVQIVGTTPISFKAPSAAGVYVIRLISKGEVYYGNLVVTQ